LEEKEENEEEEEEEEEEDNSYKAILMNNINNTLTILQTYPFVDIESNGGNVRKQLPTKELTTDLVQSYLQQYNSITLIPKKLMGNAPIRISSEKIELNLETSPISGLGSFENNSFPATRQEMPSQSSNGDIYRILYENALSEARDYKRKYEEARDEKHKAELELVGNKNSVIGDIANGLSGFAPMLMGGLNGGLGNAENAKQEQNKTETPPITDIKLKAIIQQYSKLNEENRNKLYKLLAFIFGDISNLDQFINQIK
jgi:hypothetical protein